MTDPNAQAVELNPCPFCGSADVSVDAIESVLSRWSVWCSACHTEGPNSPSVHAAAESWNRRPA